MTEAEWVTTTDPIPMLDLFRGRASERKSRLFGCALCEIYRRDFTDERSWAAVEMGYRIADGSVVGAERNMVFTKAEEVAVELDGIINFSIYLIPTFAAGSLQQIHEIPTRVLSGFDCNFYANPRRTICLLLRCVLGNPFGFSALTSSWLTSTVLALAQQMYDSRDFSSMPILADALQDAGCDNEDVLNHCRGPGPHVRGCWVVDRLLSKQ